LWFTDFDTDNFARITTSGVVTEFAAPANRDKKPQPNGITAGPDGALWFVEYVGNVVVRAPACALGFSASYATGTLTMNYNLGIDTPATFNLILQGATGPIGEPFSMPIGLIVPPKSFTLNWTVPDLGPVGVHPVLAAGSGQPICSEWTTVNTAN
jgi:virginiamycin B lyase